MVKEASENPRCVRESNVSCQGEEFVLNNRVGESSDRSVRAKKVSQQAEKYEDPVTQKVSDVREERKISR